MRCHTPWFERRVTAKAPKSASGTPNYENEKLRCLALRLCCARGAFLVSLFGVPLALSGAFAVFSVLRMHSDRVHARDARAAWFAFSVRGYSVAH
jgi:hypothetical protein